MVMHYETYELHELMLASVCVEQEQQSHRILRSRKKWFPSYSLYHMLSFSLLKRLYDVYRCGHSFGLF